MNGALRLSECLLFSACLSGGVPTQGFFSWFFTISRFSSFRKSAITRILLTNTSYIYSRFWRSSGLMQEKPGALKIEFLPFSRERRRRWRNVGPLYGGFSNGASREFFADICIRGGGQLGLDRRTSFGHRDCGRAAKNHPYKRDRARICRSVFHGCRKFSLGAVRRGIS